MSLNNEKHPDIFPLSVTPEHRQQAQDFARQNTKDLLAIFRLSLPLRNSDRFSA